MKKVLIMCGDIPYPPIYGGRIDFYYKLHLFKLMGYDVNLIFTYNRENDLKEGIPKLKEICSNIYFYKRKKSIISSLSIKKPYYVLSSKPSKKEEADLDAFINDIGRLDLIVIDQPHTFEIYKSIRNRHKLHETKVLFRMHNNESEFLNTLYKNVNWTSRRKYLYLLDMYRMKKYENDVLNQVDIIASISMEEKKQIDKTHNNKSIWLPALYKPLGFEDRNILLDSDEMRTYSDLQEKFKGKNVLLFTSSFKGGFNVAITKWFLMNVLPIILEKLPDVVFVFGGFGANEYFKDYINDHIYIYSDVPSIRPYLKIADLNLVITDSGAGVKLKLIEALYYRKKVVSTKEGVIGSGLEDIIPNSNDPHEFANYCVEILKENIDYNKIMKIYEEKYGLENIAKRLNIDLDRFGI